MKSECFIASLWPFAASTPPVHCASVTLSDKKSGNDEGVKCRWTMLNHVEPFHFATQLLTAWKDLVQTLHLPRQLHNTCRKPSSKDFKVWHSEIQCFNIFQHVSIYVSLAPDGMLRFRVPLCSAGTTGWWWAWVMSKIPWGKVQTWVLEGR